MPKISLEQWQALVAVVETGGYAQAAERLHKSQSTLSYAVQKLERLLGVKVFEIQGRKAVLTPAGQVLYRRGKALIDEAMRLERAAASLAAGWEPEVRLAVEIVFPTWLLLECLGRFGQERPETRIELYESVLGGTDEVLREGQVDLAIASEVPEGFIGDPLMAVRFIAIEPGTSCFSRKNISRRCRLLQASSPSRRHAPLPWPGCPPTSGVTSGHRCRGNLSSPDSCRWRCVPQSGPP